MQPVDLQCLTGGSRTLKVLFFSARVKHFHTCLPKKEAASLCVWLLSLSTVFSRFIHVVACLSTTLFFVWLNNVPLYGCTPFCFSTHQLIDIWVASIVWLLWAMLLHFYTKFNVHICSEGNTNQTEALADRACHRARAQAVLPSVSSI